MVSKVQSLKLDTSVWSNEIVQVRQNPESHTHQRFNCTTGEAGKTRQGSLNRCDRKQGTRSKRQNTMRHTQGQVSSSGEESEAIWWTGGG